MIQFKPSSHTSNLVFPLLVHGQPTKKWLKSMVLHYRVVLVKQVICMPKFIATLSLGLSKVLWIISHLNSIGLLQVPIHLAYCLIGGLKSQAVLAVIFMQVIQFRLSMALLLLLLNAEVSQISNLK